MTPHADPDTTYCGVAVPDVLACIVRSIAHAPERPSSVFTVKLPTAVSLIASLVCVVESEPNAWNEPLVVKCAVLQPL